MNNIVLQLEKQLSPLLRKKPNNYGYNLFRDVSLSLVGLSYIALQNDEYKFFLINAMNDPENFIEIINDNKQSNDNDYFIKFIRQNSLIQSFFNIIHDDKEIHEIILSLWKKYFINSEFNLYEILPNIFGQLLKITSTTKLLGEGYTPTNIVSLMSQLVQPKKGDRVYDPVCGTGGFLVSVSNIVDKICNFSSMAYGTEINQLTADVARMNLLVNGKAYNNIITGNCFNDPVHNTTLQPEKFDIVLANPPFSIKDWSTKDDPLNKDFEFGPPPRTCGDFAFIQHSLSLLNDKGRAGIIVPPGVLFRAGAERKIRSNIIKSGILESVIQLPNNIFIGTSISACILVFNNERKSNDILLVDASNYYSKSQSRNRLDDTHIKKIIEIVFNRESNNHNSYLASHDEIKHNNYDLNLSHYFNNNPKTKLPTTNELFKKQLKLQKKLKDLQEEMHMFK